MFKILFLVAFLGTGLFGIAQPSVGQTASDISLPDASGKLQKLSSLKGKVVLIDFWASWCGPCRRSNKDMVGLYSKYREKGFEIYSISLDQDKKDWRSAVMADKMNWTHVIEGPSTEQVSTKWKVEFLPTTYLLDKEGRVVAIDPSKAKLEAYLKQNLIGKP